MRASIALTLLAGVTLLATGPAAAQAYRGLALAQEAQREADAQAARSRDIALTNELSTLQARVQSTQGLSDLAAMRAPPATPIVPRPPGAPSPRIDAGQFASIPDAELADSNAKVRAAADNHH
ncbi:MAG TPA: hypothetical protein VIE16_10815 [Phenylobacterium sp.]|jgi:hypothetical protein